MHRLCLTGLVPVLIVISGAARAAPVVTEAEFLSVLDDAHPAVAERAAAVAAARARVVAAETFENPALEIAREDPSGPAEHDEWAVSWQLPSPSRRLAIEGRRQDVAAAEARLADDLLALRLTLAEVYAEWAVAAERHGRLAAHAARVEALATRETARTERGETSGLEARRLALAATTLGARAALAAAEEEAARAVARGWYPEMPADAEPVLPALEPPPALAAEPARLRAARAELDAANLERQVAGRFVRSPEVSLGWLREADPETVEGPVFGLAWSLPLLDRNQAEKALADARVDAARARLGNVRREVDAARAAALAAYRRLADALADARTLAADQDRMLAGAEAAFRLGEGSLTDLLETLRTVAEADAAALDLHQAALAARRRLERLAGSPHARFPIDKETVP